MFFGTSGYVLKSGCGRVNEALVHDYKVSLRFSVCVERSRGGHRNGALVRGYQVPLRSSLTQSVCRGHGVVV